MSSKDGALGLLQRLVNPEPPKGRRESPTKERRHTACLKNPERRDKDRDDWFIYVPSFFNDCLDIQRTNRVLRTKERDAKTGEMKDKKEVRKVWTQGSRFAFHRGCILYDTPNAYRSWRDAVREVRYCVSIRTSVAAEPPTEKKWRVHGEVEFSVLSPSMRNMSLEEVGTYTLTQDEFIAFLINGNREIIPT